MAGPLTNFSLTLFSRIVDNIELQLPFIIDLVVAQNIRHSYYIWKVILLVNIIISLFSYIFLLIRYHEP